MCRRSGYGAPRGHGDLILVDGEPLLGLEENEFGGLDLSLNLMTDNDTQLVRIDKNEWISDKAGLPWDIESDFQYLGIRQRRGDIRFVDRREGAANPTAGQPVEKRPKHHAGAGGFCFKSLSLKFHNFRTKGMCINIDSVTGAPSFVSDFILSVKIGER